MNMRQLVIGDTIGSWTVTNVSTGERKRFRMGALEIDRLTTYTFECGCPLRTKLVIGRDEYLDTFGSGPPSRLNFTQRRFIEKYGVGCGHTGCTMVTKPAVEAALSKVAMSEPKARRRGVKVRPITCTIPEDIFGFVRERSEHQHQSLSWVVTELLAIAIGDLT